MENDTISRSALVAELEAFKMSLGDIVLRFVVDRVIDLVKTQPKTEAPVPTRFELTTTGLKFYYADGRVTEVLL